MYKQSVKSLAGILRQQSKLILCSNYHVKHKTKSIHTGAGGQNYKQNQPLTNLLSSSQKPLDNETKREVQHHSDYASDWWNKNGSMKALHSLNAVRIPFIRDGLVARGNIRQELVNTSQVLNGQHILEIGCGGGILTEQLGRLGAHVTGIDLSEDLICAARDHLLQEADPNLCDLIQYKIEPLNVHAKENINYYNAVVISEVLEHVDDKISFLTSAVQCLKPGGSIFITTLNKTIPMWIGGVLICEYVLRIAPIGTHHWDKMISPLDVQRILDTMGCSTVVVNGCTYDFWSNTWRWINSTNFCYALQAIKTEV